MPALSAQPAPVGEGVLLVDLDGTVVEQPSQPDAAELLSGQAIACANIACATWSRRSTRRRDDDRVKAVALDLDGFLGGGQSAMAELGAAVRRVRASGKPVAAYATGYSDDGYQLAANASEIWLNPLGAVVLAGPGRQKPLLQGPARQAGGDRQRLSRRHLQVGGRALSSATTCRPRRARSCAGAGRRLARNLARRRRQGAAAGGGRRLYARYRGRGRGGRRRHAPRRRWPPNWSTGSPTGGRSRRGSPNSAARTKMRRAATRRIKLDSYIDDAVDTDPQRADRHRHRRRRDRRRQGAGRDRGRRQHRRSDREGPSRRRAQGAGRPDRQPRRVGHGVRAHPPGAARRQGAEIAGRRVDGQRRRVGRLLGRDPGRFHLRRAVDGHRIDRRVRHPAELPGNDDQARARRRRDQDDPAVGRARPVPRPLARGQSADPDRRRRAPTASSSASSPQSRRKSPADIDRIAQGRVWDGGTARQLGLVDGFGGMDEAIAKAAQLAKLGRRARRHLPRAPAKPARRDHRGADRRG